MSVRFDRAAGRSAAGVRWATRGATPGGTDTLFYETTVSKPMVLPAEQGDYGLLKKYVNVSAVDFVLLVAWIAYTLAHPKVPTTKYLHLVILGDQGSGKSTLSSLLLIVVIRPRSRAGVVDTRMASSQPPCGKSG